VVNGINLATLLWSEAGALVPTDFRIYDKPNDGFTKNDHFRAMLKQAKERGFEPRYVLFDSWYSSLDNLKAIRSYGWRWLCRLKSNRLVNPDKSGNQCRHPGGCDWRRRSDSTSEGLRNGKGVQDGR
jgi:putative transposase